MLGDAARKGQSWDNPEAVLDGLKRASSANIPGMKVSHMKFNTPADGNTSYVLSNAKQYQKEASGDAGLSFNLNNVSFDNVSADGRLVDRKWGHSTSIFNSDGSPHNNSRVTSMIDQADRQIAAANGKPIRWEISTKLGAEGIQDLFDANDIPIDVKYIPQNSIMQ